MIDTSQSKKRKYSAFGKKVVKQLVNKNMTARQLADALGITPQYLNEIIHGRKSGEKYIEAIKALLDMAA